MPVYQSQSNGLISYKAQSGLGSPASGSGGIVLRTTGGPGLQLSKATTASAEVRADGMRVRGRHGVQKTSGQWSHEASIGSIEEIVQAVMRDTWSSADTAITEATGGLTSITTGANTIVNGGGSWITAGVRVGQVYRLTNHTSAGNNGRNLRVTGVTSTTITLAETLTVNATPDTSFTLTRAGKEIYQTGTQVKRYYTIDEWDGDTDYSETASDFVFGSLRFAMRPNGLLTCELGGMGTGQFTANNSAASPVLTTPTASTGVPLAVSDATIRLNGTDLVELSDFGINLDITPSTPDVFGSGNIKYAPDVATGQMGVSLNLTALRKDLQFMSDYAAETVYDMHVLAVENTTEPKRFFSIYVPEFTLGSVQKSPLSVQGGFRTVTINVPIDLVGKRVPAAGYYSSMIQFQSVGA